MIRFVYACLPSEAAHCLGGNNTILHLSLIVFFLPLKTNTRNAKYYSSKRGRPFLFLLLLSRAAAGPLQKQKGIRRRSRRRMRCATLKRLCIRPTEDLTRKRMLSMNHFLSQTVRNSIAFEFLQSRRILN